MTNSRLKLEKNEVNNFEVWPKNTTELKFGLVKKSPFNYKRHNNNNKGGGNRGERLGGAKVVGRGGGKGRKLYLNNNKKNVKIKKSVQFFSITQKVHFSFAPITFF